MESGSVEEEKRQTGVKKIVLLERIGIDLWVEHCFDSETNGAVLDTKTEEIED